MRNLFSLGVSRPHHPRRSVVYLVTKPRYETSKSVTKPLFFRPTLFKALRNRYEIPQNPMFRNKRVEGVA